MQSSDQMSENIIRWNFFYGIFKRGNTNRNKLIILKVVQIHEQDQKKRGDNNLICSWTLHVATVFFLFFSIIEQRACRNILFNGKGTGLRLKFI